MTIVISTLRTELLTGSFANLYSASVTIFDINALGVTVNQRGLTGSSITVGIAIAEDIQRSVVGTEYLVLTQPQRDLWGMLITTAINGVPISNTLIRGQIAAVWSAATTTRGNLSALQTRPCSRGETLFGEGETVDYNSIYVALTQP